MAENSDFGFDNFLFLVTESENDISHMCSSSIGKILTPLRKVIIVCHVIVIFRIFCKYIAIADRSHRFEYGHYTYMTDLAETCSHIAGTRYSLKTTVHIYSGTITKVALQQVMQQSRHQNSRKKGTHSYETYISCNKNIPAHCINRNLARLVKSVRN